MCAMELLGEVMEGGLWGFVLLKTKAPAPVPWGIVMGRHVVSLFGVSSTSNSFKAFAKAFVFDAHSCEGMGNHFVPVKVGARIARTTISCNRVWDHRVLLPTPCDLGP